MFIRSRSLAAIALVLCAWAIAPASVHAHAAFEDARPEPGANVASSPAQITVAFSEPLDRALSRAQIVDARSGRAIASNLSFAGADRIVLRPTRPLPTGAYHVRWHTVSIRDGHTLGGSFGFGVRTRAIGGAARLEQSPLARGGWLRVALRCVWYLALFFFGAGVLCGLLLRSATGPGGWLLASNGGAALAPGGRADPALARIQARTQAAGWVAVAAGIGVALAETSDAAGSLSWHSVDSYLLSTAAGAARALAPAGVAIAVLLANRAPRVAGCAVVAVLAALAVGGHADSSSPRALALLSDWAHLAAAVVWAGGVAQIVLAWLPSIVGLPPEDRRLVIRAVLSRFGRLALPAFAVVVVAGAANALIELGSVAELWQTAFGRVLLVKIALVGAIGAASYAHAFVLRPRIVNGAAAPAVERHHWQLLGSQPGLAVLVLCAAAVLVAFPLPPRQLLVRAEAGEQKVSVTPLRPPRPGELAVAEEAGPWIAAAWVKPGAEASSSGTVRLLDYELRPVPARLRILGARTAGCGPGCVTFTATPAPATLRVLARVGSRAELAGIPIRWLPHGTATATRILAAAVAAMSRLRSFQIVERLSSGLGGPPAVSHYRIAGRQDFTIRVRSAGTFEEIALGRRVWTLQPGGSWQEQVGPPQDTRVLMPWWTHRVGVRLLDVHVAGGRRIADIGLADIHRPSVSIPFWFRLRIDLASMRVLAMRMITVAHFMDQRYYAFNVPVAITPPARRR